MMIEFGNVISIKYDWLENIFLYVLLLVMKISMQIIIQRNKTESQRQHVVQKHVNIS